MRVGLLATHVMVEKVEMDTLQTMTRIIPLPTG